MTTYTYWRLTNGAKRPPFYPHAPRAKRTYAIRMTDQGDVTGVCGPLENGTEERFSDLLPNFRYDEDDLSGGMRDWIVDHSGDFRQVGGQVRR